MFDSFSRSWKLTKLSWKVLMADKELLLFPVFSAIGAILLFIGIVMPSVIISGAEDGTISYLTLALWYLVTSFVVIFFQSALVACVKKRLSGGNPTIGYGLGQAGKRIIPIIGWSIISATVGLILRMLADRAENQGGIAGIVGQIIVSMIGFAWTIVTMFVVPVMIIENQGVFASLKKSGALVRKTWGEQVVMTVGLGYAFFFIYLAIIGLTFLTVFLIPSAIVFAIIVAVFAVAIVAVFQSALNGVFSGVLYSYAVGDNVPREFKDVAGELFQQKKTNGILN